MAWARDPETLCCKLPHWCTHEIFISSYAWASITDAQNAQKDAWFPYSQPFWSDVTRNCHGHITSPATFHQFNWVMSTLAPSGFETRDVLCLRVFYLGPWLLLCRWLVLSKSLSCIGEVVSAQSWLDMLTHSLENSSKSPNGACLNYDSNLGKCLIVSLWLWSS